MARHRPPEERSATPPRGFVRDAALVGSVAILLRAAYLLVARRSPLFDYLHLDPLYYVSWGRRIASGEILGAEVFEQSPLYPYLLGAFFALFGERFLLLRALQFAAGAAACVLIAALGRRAFGPRAGLAAGLLAAAYGPFLFYEGQVMKSFLTYLLTSGALLLLLRAAPEGREEAAPPAAAHLLPPAAAGLLLGLQALVRENAVLLLPALALWAGWRDRGSRRGHPLARPAALLAGAALAILPVTLRNAAVSGDLVLLTAGGGEVFYIGNYADANGAYLPPDFVRPSPVWEHQDFRDEAARRTGEPMTRTASSRYWMRQGLAAIAADPPRWLRLELRKLALFFNARELPDNYSYAVFAREIPLLRFLPGFGLVAPLGLVGMGLTWRRWRELLPLHLVTATYVGSVLLFFNFSRFRLPAMPVLLVFAGAAAVALWDALRQRRPGRAAAVAGATLLLALPMRIELTAATDAPGQEEILLGYARLDADQPEAAAEAFATARRRIEAFRAERGTAPGLELGSACYGLGSAFLAMDRAGEAVEPLRCAAELSPRDAATLERYADALKRAGMEREAEEALRRRIDLPPPRFPIYFDLATLRFQRGDAAGALAIFERGRTECPDMSQLDEADYHLGMAIVLMDGLGRPQEALPHLREVLRLAPEHAQAAEIRRHLTTLGDMPTPPPTE